MTTATRRVFDVRFTLLVGLHVLTLATCGALWLKERGPATVSAAERERSVGARLAGAGLHREAAERYERALAEMAKGPDRARLAFATAELYERDAQIEKALGWYFEVEAADPNAEVKAEAAKRIVALLEGLGKVSVAKQALAELSLIHI